jgi:putative membrane protein
MIPLHALPEAGSTWIAKGGLVAAAGLVSLLHLRGWARLHRRRSRRPVGAVAAFQAGLATLLVAVLSPLDTLADRSLSFHMTQHLLLMMVAPPLLWSGSPCTFIRLGLPRGLRRATARLLGAPPLHAVGRWATHPVACWLAFVLATWAWHLPAAYEWALRDELVHDAEHLCFLGTGLLFWWPVIHPWPARPAGPQWWIVPYLSLAMLENTAFSAVFTFSDRVLYPSYLAAAPPGGLSPLDDQALGGAIMWIGGSLAMLVPGVLAVVRLLGPSRPGARSAWAVELGPPVLERDLAGLRAGGAAASPGGSARPRRPRAPPSRGFRS